MSKTWTSSFKPGQNIRVVTGGMRHASDRNKDKPPKTVIIIHVHSEVLWVKWPTGRITECGITSPDEVVGTKEYKEYE